MEKAFSEEAKHFGDHIVSEIKVQFIKKLSSAEWMSKDVRELGIEKGIFLSKKAIASLFKRYCVSLLLASQSTTLSKKLGIPRRAQISETLLP